jgi:polysaccharide export outer membrane protein
MNIYEAIGNASGITNFADLKNIVVNRQIGNMTNSFKIDLTKDNVYNSDVYYLQPNDLVYIPPTNMAMRDEGRSNYSLFLGTISSVLLIVSIILTSTH